MPEIKAGKIGKEGVDGTQRLNTGDKVAVNAFDSRGRCGAKITATYVPLLFQPGLSGGTTLSITSIRNGNR